jgi:hypothetical protein
MGVAAVPTPHRGGERPWTTAARARLPRVALAALTSLAMTSLLVAGCTADETLAPKPRTAPGELPTASAPVAPTAPAAPATTPATAPATTSITEPAAESPESADVDALLATLGCLTDGARRGAWTVRFAGYGCAALGGDTTAGAAPATPVVALSPRAATSPDATHAALVLGPALSSDGGEAAHFRTRVHTARQLRTGSAPNPWEVAWVVWHYADDAHFYYFIPKPTGWELGKRDPAYPGGQRFLATGADRRFPVGAWYDVEVAQRGRTITVAVDGVPVVSAVDGERACTRRHVGVYAEDASVTARDVALPPP